METLEKGKRPKKSVTGTPMPDRHRRQVIGPIQVGEQQVHDHCFPQNYRKEQDLLIGPRQWPPPSLDFRTKLGTEVFWPRHFKGYGG